MFRSTSSRTSFPSSGQAVLDLLPWDRFLAPGVLANVDGALASTFEYRGPDLSSATAGEIESLSRSLTRAIDPLGDGWMLHFEAHRLPAPPYPGSEFPDPFTAAVDAERRQRFESRQHYVSRYYLTLTHQEPALVEGPAWRQGPGGQAEEKRLERFKTRVREFAGLLEPHLELEALSSRQLLAHLYRSLTFRHGPLNLPEVQPVSLEHVLGAGDLELGYRVRFGEVWIVPVSIAGFPASAHAASLEFLAELAFPLHVSARYVPFDRITARSAIEGRKTHWASASVRLKQLLASFFSRSASSRGGAPAGSGDAYGDSMREDADEALLYLEREETTAGTMTLVALIPHRDFETARERADAVVSELRNRGFVAWVEETNAGHAYLGSLPAVGSYNPRRPLVVTRTFVDLALTTSVWTGSPTHPHPKLARHGAHLVAATGSTPIYLSLAHGDVQHSLVLGPTGTGKSVLVNLLIHQYLRYPQAQVLAIDKGWSLYGATRAAGGHHYALSPDAEAATSYRFAPVAELDTPADRMAASAWLQELLVLQGLEVGPAEVAALNRALELLAGSPSRTLKTLASKVQSVPIREALAPYTSGPVAHLFGGTTNPLRDGGPLHVFEMEQVLPLQDKAVVPLVLHLFAEIERRLDGRPTLIVIEEALGYLGQTLWAERFALWLHQLRKKNAGVLIVGQSLSAFLDSSLKDAVLEACPTRIFLPNRSAQEPSTASHYHAFGLNERQVELVAGATPRRDYYVDSPSGSRLIRLGLSPAVLDVYRLAGPEGRGLVDELVAAHGEAWLAEYLASRGHEELLRLLHTFQSPPEEVR